MGFRHMRESTSVALKGFRLMPLLDFPRRSGQMYCLIRWVTVSEVMACKSYFIFSWLCIIFFVSVCQPVYPSTSASVFVSISIYASVSVSVPCTVSSDLLYITHSQVFIQGRKTSFPHCIGARESHQGRSSESFRNQSPIINVPVTKSNS